MIKTLKEKILSKPNTYSPYDLLEYSIPYKGEKIKLYLTDEIGNVILTDLTPDEKDVKLLCHSMDGDYVCFECVINKEKFVFEFASVNGVISASGSGNGYYLNVDSSFPVYHNGKVFDKALLYGNKVVVSSSPSDGESVLINARNKYNNVIGSEFKEENDAMINCCSWNFVHDSETDTTLLTTSRTWDIYHGGWVAFCWDSFFASLIAAQFDTDIAKLNFLQTLEFVTDEGFVPNTRNKKGFITLDRSQPPVGSRVALQIYKKDADVEFMRHVFPTLKAWNEWFFANRQISDGIFTWGSKKYTPRVGDQWETNGVGDVFGCSLESGMDNSPLYDNSKYDKKTNCLTEGDVGLTSLVYADTVALSKIATICGFDNTDLLAKAKKIEENFDFFFDTENSGFFNRDIYDKTFNRSVNVTSLYAAYLPLQNDKLKTISDRLFDKNFFYGEYMIPTVSRSEKSYYDQNYWRGRIWPPTNYLTYDALTCHSSLLDAQKLVAEKSRELLLKEWLMFRHVHENYNAENGLGCSIPEDNKIPNSEDVFGSDCFYSWGALLPYIYLLFVKK